MNLERESQITIPKKHAGIAGPRAVRPALSLKKSGISSGTKSKSYGELTFDFATLACSLRPAIWTRDVITATHHNSYAVEVDNDQSESASAVLANARVIALSAVGRACDRRLRR